MIRELATVLALGGVVLWTADIVRHRLGVRFLLERYQARAFRSGPLAVMYPDPWADRPYRVYRPEDLDV